MSKKKHKHKNKTLPPSSNFTNQNSLEKDNPVPAKDTPKIIRTQTALQAFSGPIPPPDLLDKYNQMIPDGADRILKMAERQSAHRQYIEKWVIIGGTILSYLGVLCAAGIAFGALFFGYKLIQNGYIISGSALGGGGLTGLVAAFIYGTRSRKEERQERDRRNRELIRPK